MSAISYTDERAETMLFSDQPMGKEKYYLYVILPIRIFRFLICQRLRQG